MSIGRELSNRTDKLLVIPQMNYCEMECPFCDKNGFYGAEHKPLDYEKLYRVCTYVRNLGVNHATITGGECTYTPESTIVDLIDLLADFFGRVGIQTNGANLTYDSLSVYCSRGLSLVEISRHHHVEEINEEIMGRKNLTDEKVKMSKELDLITRLSCVLIKGYIDNPTELYEYILWAEDIGVDQITFRQISKVNEWSEDHFVDASFVEEFLERNGAQPLLELSKDNKLYNFKNINIYVYREELNRPELLFFPDNHLYFRWDTKASVIM